MPNDERSLWPSVVGSGLLFIAVVIAGWVRGSFAMAGSLMLAAVGIAVLVRDQMARRRTQPPLGRAGKVGIVVLLGLAVAPPIGLFTGIHWLFFTGGLFMEVGFLVAIVLILFPRSCLKRTSTKSQP